jgi:hypothetical protein
MRPRTLAFAIAAAGGSAVAIALARLKRPDLTLRRRRGSPEPETYHCACGQRFRVGGRDRHRVFWLEGAAEDDPVLSQRCPNCDRPLL